MSQLTREEIEQRLEQKYLGAVISLELIWWRPHYKTEAEGKRLNTISGKVQRIAVELTSGEPMVVFVINGKQYKVDVNYFIENITIHGDTHSRTT